MEMDVESIWLLQADTGGAEGLRVSTLADFQALEDQGDPDRS